jgi:hemolysin III
MDLPADHPRLKRRPYSDAELIADAAVHAAALIAGLIAFSVLFQQVATRGRLLDEAAIAVYAAGFFLLFGFSCAYNMTPPSRAKWLLRRFDHASIYLLIGGTYTALLSQLPASWWATALTATVWSGALIGVALKVLLPGRLDRLAIGVYLVLGWSAVAAIRPLAAALPAPTLALVAIGGVVYSVGVAFYLWRSLKFQNVIWHACVAAAAACHFAGIAAAVARAA